MSSKRLRSDPESRVGGKRQLKHQELAELNPLLLEVKERVSEAWSRGLEYSHEKGLLVDIQPFTHCVISNFIQSQTFLEGLQNELLQLNFHEKSNDLYKFKQSDDLRKKKGYHISSLRKVLFEDFRTWLSDILGVKLESTVDLSCAKYEYTEHDQPQQIAKSLTPSWNTLIFFEVSPVSIHQVSEILSEEKCRLSVSGWFHGPSLARPPCYIESLSSRNPHIASDEEILYDWINPIYLDVSTQVRIQDEFEEKSEILLKNFFKLPRSLSGLMAILLQSIRRPDSEV
ncbi:prolyl 3-hydroxylase OGFOD1-like [Scyliorhinus canicula]|uniref:prolyl 3-hydroxylase OGFOD1-like n=1 Tax=Scyliorhinus canicula TaxID=7830 RepID=UPI0018F6CE36|nr:prolyl 3-hydroxylase OGFOD1-like [Scyliorhinus canicula]